MYSGPSSRPPKQRDTIGRKFQSPSQPKTAQLGVDKTERFRGRRIGANPRTQANTQHGKPSLHGDVLRQRHSINRPFLIVIFNTDSHYRRRRKLVQIDARLPLHRRRFIVITSRLGYVTPLLC